MDDLISRQAAISEIVGMTTMGVEELVNAGDKEKFDWIKGLSDSLVKIINLPPAQPERKKGEWIEKHHAYSDEESVIEEWQSCRCSECGRYDTRPYMYFFSEPNYCSYCGADMRGES